MPRLDRRLGLLLVALVLAGCAAPRTGPAGTQLVGIVERVGGAPVEGAWVTLMMKMKPGFLNSKPAPDTALEIVSTNARGVFVFSVTPENAGNPLYFVVHGQARVRGRPAGRDTVELRDVVEDTPRFDTLNVIEVPEEFVSLPRPGPTLTP
jgi:hypothetical protein